MTELQSMAMKEMGWCCILIPAPYQQRCFFILRHRLNTQIPGVTSLELSVLMRDEREIL